jgi:hypothetical protein
LVARIFLIAAAKFSSVGGEFSCGKLHGNLYVTPKERLTPDLIERIRQHKPALLAYFRIKQQCVLINEALTLLRRLKYYTLPAGQMPAAREIAERWAARLVLWENGEPISEADDAASILAVLCDIEHELTTIGESL